MTAPPQRAAVPEAVVEAARLRRDRRVGDAVAVVEAALAKSRATPLDVPFRERVLLGLTLADLHLVAGQRDRAQEVLVAEVAFAEQLRDLIAQSGLPEQIRAASAGCLQLRDRATQVDLLGGPAPEIDLVEWAQGGPTTIAGQRGRVVLLEFWAPWCRSCTAMFPFFRDLHSRHASDGLTIIALTSHREGSGSRELVQQAIADHAVDFAVGIAPDEGLQARYGANGIPTFALIDRDGLVRLASSKPDKAALEEAVIGLLEHHH
ncbi:TlpA disulfide reductase family protein [Mycolicibacterium sp. CR10]|uniref:TlpA family protein disulfide reductase n=1 Tax=Mycolicibacterium sp. CR10 TaxID=2562314 RepID=UPI0014855E58|nr:TlpA disulfide reductase family protein [Mycolicibacterium sp. CR10]